jgi:hypothetical protein
MLLWRMPFSLPSLPAASAIGWIVADWCPAIEYIYAQVNCSRTGYGGDLRSCRSFDLDVAA